MEKIWLRKYDPQVEPSLTSDPSSTMVTFLEAAAQKFPEHTCLIDGDRHYTYHQTFELVMRVAQNLVRLGITKGTRIGLSLPNCSEFVIAYYGILRAGAVVVAINPFYKEREFAYQIKDADIDCLICSEEKAKEYLPLLGTGLLKKIIIVDGDHPSKIGDRNAWAEVAAEYSDSIFSFHRLTGNLDDAIELPIILPDDIAILQYSGGTTGEPKGAIGLHRNLAANTQQFTQWLSTCKPGQEVVLAAIPLYHVYGMVIAMSIGMALGASLVLIRNPRDITGILEKIQEHQATLFPGVPNMYAAINQNPAVKQGVYDLTSIKICISGSAPLAPEVKHTFESLISGTLAEGYGLSEAPTATHCNPINGDNRPGSIGLPLPDVECKIVDLEDGSTELPTGEAGELVIKGPQVMAGYHGRPDETSAILKGGWLYTGDIAYVDADGYFYLVARKKELIKIGGFQVWPREIEEVLTEHPAIKEAAVAGIAGVNLTERIKAWIVINSGSQITEQDVRAWSRKYLAGYKVPALVEFIDELPRTSVGKILKRELIRRHVENGQG